MVLTVHHASADVRETCPSHYVSGDVQHVSRNICGQHVATRPYSLSSQKGLVSRASRHVKYTVAGTEIGQVKHPFSGCPIDLTTSCLAMDPPFCTLSIPLRHSNPFLKLD